MDTTNPAQADRWPSLEDEQCGHPCDDYILGIVCKCYDGRFDNDDDDEEEEYHNDLPDLDDYDEYDGEDGPCDYCGGDGWGIVGVDWDCEDGVNGPYIGETERCPNCHGSGLAKDMTFW